MPAPVLTSCPNCGRELAAVDTTAAPQWAPWLCATCARGWWPSELTPAARRVWRATSREFTDRAVLAAAAADAAIAAGRGGTS